MYTERAVRRTYDARNERAARTMATFIISLCAILMLTTVSGLICRKAQLPEVIGQILVGILVGPSLLGVMHMSDSLSLFSDLGIIILMFLGGVGCDLQLLKKYSKAAVIIACMGVVFPVAGMGGVSLLFGFKPIPAAFIGVVFSATSVSISVAVLKEAGLLDSKEGVSILGAAVADDVIGVILLSVMCTLVNTGSVDVAGLGLILLKQVLFFVAAAVVVVWVAPALMTLAGVLKAPSGIAVMAVIICLAMAWASNLAGLSYAVGAFFAGIAVSNSDYAEDADRYIEPVGDTLFVPVFFVGIGLQTTGVDDTKMIVFIAIMTVLGVITKVVGCGLGGRMAGFGGASALMIGAGMVPRGEMALITAQIGFNEHVLGSEYYSTIIFIISLVTLVAPLLLKLTIRKVPGVGAAAGGTAGGGAEHNEGGGGGGRRLPVRLALSSNRNTKTSRHVRNVMGGFRYGNRKSGKYGNVRRGCRRRSLPDRTGRGRPGLRRGRRA